MKKEIISKVAILATELEIQNIAEFLIKENKEFLKQHFEEEDCSNENDIDKYIEYKNSIYGAIKICIKFNTNEEVLLYHFLLWDEEEALFDGNMLQFVNGKLEGTLQEDNVFELI